MSTATRYEPRRQTSVIPQPFADLGYWAREYDDHVVSIGYKDEQEFAAFAITEETASAVLDALVRHLLRTAVAA